MKIKGIEEMQRRLRKLSDNVRRLDGDNQVTASELFPTAFMQENSRFASIEEMFAARGVVDVEALAALSEDEWDLFVAQTTRFRSWEEMKAAGARAWVAAKINL